MPVKLERHFLCSSHEYPLFVCKLTFLGEVAEHKAVAFLSTGGFGIETGNGGGKLRKMASPNALPELQKN